ncbi:hypothetical protein MUP59_00820 [Candidatus Bathyarchaeota archaeon]|nr:hypothetical protein [Candidatus Bathyarchaeota archaeon]
MPSKLSWHSRRKVAYSITAWEINQAYYFDGFNSMTIEGLQRLGKTAYASKCFAQAFGEWQINPEPHCVKPDFESVKEWMTFLPREYLDSIMDVYEKVRGLILDDAGLWLYALDWYDPFVKAVNKWMQVCGTRFGSVFMTTPNKNLISSKILDALPDMKVCRIERAGYDQLFYRPRLAKVYERWDYPDGKKGGVKTKWEDKFNAILPNDYFAWYKPRREQYVDIALKLLRSEIVKIDRRLGLEGKRLSEAEKEKIAEKEGIMEDVHRVVGDERLLLEVDEVIANLEREQAEKQVIGRS